MNDIRKRILKVNENRNHSVKNSLGVYDAYKYIRKNKWFDIGKPVSEHDFYTIIRSVNNYLADEIVNGNDINLPYRLGRIELRKYSTYIKYSNGKIVNNLPIDWDRTLELWAEDSESFKNKTIIKAEEKEIFKVYYNKKNAEYNNKSFYEFKVNRDIKKRLKHKIKGGAVDAFEI